MKCVRQSLEGVAKSDDGGLSRMTMACYVFFAARSCSAITAISLNWGDEVKSWCEEPPPLFYKLSLLAGEAASLMSCLLFRDDWVVDVPLKCKETPPKLLFELRFARWLNRPRLLSYVLLLDVYCCTWLTSLRLYERTPWVGYCGLSFSKRGLYLFLCLFVCCHWWLCLLTRVVEVGP